MKRCSAPAGTNSAMPSRERRRRALDLEDAASLEHDVDLVLVVGLLPVGLRGDEDVHADLEPRRAVHDLVAAAALDQRPAGRVDVERVGGGHESSVAARAHARPRRAMLGP